jgi:transaldolase
MTTQCKYIDLSTDLIRMIRGDMKFQFDGLHALFDTCPAWDHVRKTGTHLWMDSGDIEAIESNWTREFNAVTVNNTLLSREIQKGTYDGLIVELSEHLQKGDGTDKGPGDFTAEISGMLNIHHGLRLVEKFDAHVSIEAHTALANDVAGTVAYAKQAYAVCPERFYIKIPWTPAGLLATRQLSREGVPVNLTLGFSARQNYVAARLARPMFVNVFLGRLGAFVSQNNLGDGQYVGEKATLASQEAIKTLRQKEGIKTRQIGASFRDAQQLYDLIGIDIMTLPPKVVAEYRAMDVGLDRIVDRTNWEYVPVLKEGVDPGAIGLETLWHVEDALIACVDELDEENLDKFTPADLVAFGRNAGCEDLFVSWTQEEQQISREEGKIPDLEHWSVALSRRQMGLDSLMNLAALNAFIVDQGDMDAHVEKTLQGVLHR